MTYFDVPVSIVLGDQLIICADSRTLAYKLHGRKKPGATIAICQEEFRKNIRGVIRADHAPAWCFG